MLTPKDVLYMEDILDQTLVLNKRVANDISMIQSEDVKTCFENVQGKLKEHYQTLLAILESEAK
ncbi:oxidoreductase [[Clostridium] innocuum]|uniref:oxidoreductase n=1 Tax=Clostridium innocuum TaxID=1522 RepID=UPI0032597826